MTILCIPNTRWEFNSATFNGDCAFSKQQQFGLEKITKIDHFAVIVSFVNSVMVAARNIVLFLSKMNPIHNYLCASYRYFFEQTALYIQAMARQIRLHPSI